MSRGVLNLFVLGHGQVGGHLLDQLAAHGPALHEAGLEVRVVALADTRRVLVRPQGLPLPAWRALVDDTPAHLPDVRPALARLGHLPRRVLVDCTAADGMGALYAHALAAGWDVVTANKKPLCLPLAEHRALLALARATGRALHYRCTVGGGLPILPTLQALVATGDRVRRIEGALSGTLGFLCDALGAGTPLSQAVREARARGYTEPHPREDLGGADAGRKALVLAREAGLAAEPADVVVEPFVPRALLEEPDVERFLGSLEALDAGFAARVTALQARGEVLRYLAQVVPAEGGRWVLRVGPTAVPQGHPAASLHGPEALVALGTERYPDVPLVIRGPGAGGAVTAAGVLADVLRVARERPTAVPEASGRREARGLGLF